MRKILILLILVISESVCAQGSPDTLINIHGYIEKAVTIMNALQIPIRKHYDQDGKLEIEIMDSISQQHTASTMGMFIPLEGYYHIGDTGKINLIYIKSKLLLPVYIYNWVIKGIGEEDFISKKEQFVFEGVFIHELVHYLQVPPNSKYIRYAEGDHDKYFNQKQESEAFSGEFFYYLLNSNPEILNKIMAQPYNFLDRLAALKKAYSDDSGVR